MISRNLRFIFILITIVLFSCSKDQDNQVNIVMLGHSLVAGVHWNRDLGRSDIINRGRNGESIFQMRDRLQEEVIDYNPKTCYLLLGYEVRNSNNIDSAFTTVVEMANSLSNENINFVLQSSIFYSTVFTDYEESNENLKIFNEKIEEWVNQQNSDKIFYLDLNHLYAPEGVRLEHFTRDGIHLNDLGNEVWISEVAKFNSIHGF